ncbi:AAA family ATPase [Pseudomonas simiae]|uniref:ATP-dependent nuclease n=1 Tax=Pseudomonas simiae TaxID=321846 RepID=UPI0015943C84|nr:ATP-binding protein [Pseudomonas simiae]NVH63856.1 AAA family ATPase [Pseudomonas simiae]
MEQNKMPIKLDAVKIENFKAIKEATIPLSTGLTVLVGQNSSGKSSALQAIHWACRCVANPKVVRNQSRSISAHDFDFNPTIQIRTVGNNQELRQGRGENPEVSVKVTFSHSTNDGQQENLESIVKISQGNNEAVKVDLSNDSINADFYTILSDQNRPFSSYIPGLAGVPLAEEKRSRLPILKQAASGDANTVLRNILLLIKDDPRDDVSIEKLSELCSKVLGAIKIKVEFDEIRHSEINAKIQTSSMAEDYWTPLEMAGTGVLQCIQIFAYIILYRPQLLLIDEPDAHLHPDRQENLILALAEVVNKYEMSIVLTTHSPNVVRAMPISAQIVWMNEGVVHEEDGDNIRQRMGWGILDKKIILITEDGKPAELKSILKQWPQLERAVSVWPVSGSKSLPTLNACESLLNMTCMPHIVLHRDGDFMTPKERAELKKKYDHANVTLWITDDTDIESLFLNPERIARIYEIEIEEVNRLYEEIFNENAIGFEDKFVGKRQDIAEDRRIYQKRDDATKAATAKQEIPLGEGGLGRVLGKDFSKKLKEKLAQQKKDASIIFSIHDNENNIGLSLQHILNAALAH